jgi:ribosomal protein S12 methylthiotransferase accessory factor
LTAAHDRSPPRLGPADPFRAHAAAALLPAARAAAAEAGVTRLAEVTRLDRFGLPVWQAVRPMSRALSVHQGKGATDDEARLGALLEAVESDRAERFAADGPVCRFDSLPEQARAEQLDDFAAGSGRIPADEAYRWVAADDLAGGGTFHLPFELVSLDLSWGVPSPFDRASNGVATGSSRDEAINVALHELIERDSVTEWQAGGLLARMDATLDLDSVPFDWLQLWRARIAQAGAALRFYRVPTLTGTPLFACEINDLAKEGAYYGMTEGRGCHAEPEIALFKALAEALQTRLTAIAGSRDDLFDSHYAPRAGGVRVAFGLPLPDGMTGVRWETIAPGPRTWPELAERLARAGYRRIGVVPLGTGHGFETVRAFVGGLGAMRRRRRAPLA